MNLMKLFDSHCHIDDKSFDKDFEEVIERSKTAGVIRALIAGVTLKSSKKGVAIAESQKGIYAAVGIHPHDAESCSEETLETLKALSGSPKVCAWGETGLDFNRMFSPQKIQEKWFIKQIEAASKLNLPLIFHERDSKGRFLEILKANLTPGMTGVVHCFSGNQAELEAYLDLGLYIGITGILTIKTRGVELRELVKHIPDNRLLIETDAPYLTPAPEKNRIRRNEPAFVKSTFLKLSEIKQTKHDILAEEIWNNTCGLFNINSSD